MGIKVYYKSPVIWNMVLYSIFSLAFLYFQNIYRFNSTIMSKVFYLEFMESFWPIFAMVILTVICLLKDLRKLASMLFIVLVGLTLSITTYNLFVEFAKLPLVLLFFYLLFGFYLYQFYYSEIEESYYNPMFSKNDLFAPMNKNINVKICKEDEPVAHGVLTNWSKDGCFIKFDDALDLKGTYTIVIEYEGFSFEDKANFVSSTSEKNGYGFKFVKLNMDKNTTSLGWGHFYEIIDEMGFTPELLR